MTIMNDWSARALQMEEMKLNLGPAKGKDFATSLGPWLVTLDELAPAHDATPSAAACSTSRCGRRVNGKPLSQGNVKDMTWTFAQILERASYGVALVPGRRHRQRDVRHGVPARAQRLEGHARTCGWGRATRRARDRRARAAGEPRGPRRAIGTPDSHRRHSGQRYQSRDLRSLHLCDDRHAMPTLRHFTVVPRLPRGARATPRHRLQPLVVLVARRARALRPPRSAISGRPCAATPSSCWPASIRSGSTSSRATTRSRATSTPPGRTFQRYMQREGWFSKTFPEAAGARIAYFSMEYGLHECLPIYSGGLGVLAGDHLKTASDLGLPLVGVGPRVRRGLLPPGAQRRRLAGRALPHQRLAPHAGLARARRHGQAAHHPRAVPARRRATRSSGRCRSGRVPLLLLDANLAENAPGDRSITGPLYGGDQEFRVRQEIMLGIGGIHALEAVGLSPTVCHMNEGHSAFLAVERIGRVMRERGVPFAVAAEANSAGNVFTTHTPVPAGNDAFEPDARAAGTSSPTAPPLGHRRGRAAGPRARRRRATTRAPFSMPVLAMRAADHYNGVSELHGEVSRKMWQGLWPDLPEPRDPHRLRSPTACTRRRGSPSEMGALFTRYLGPRWAEQLDDAELWARAYEIPDAELWQVHEHRRHRLVQHARRWLRATAERRGAGREEHRARRRGARSARARPSASRGASRPTSAATLLFTDLERVQKLLGDPDRPGAARLRRQGAPAGQGRQGAHPVDHPRRAATRACAGASSSSRTTTCASRARW